MYICSKGVIVVVPDRCHRSSVIWDEIPCFLMWCSWLENNGSTFDDELPWNGLEICLGPIFFVEFGSLYFLFHLYLMHF